MVALVFVALAAGAAGALKAAGWELIAFAIGGAILVWGIGGEVVNYDAEQAGFEAADIVAANCSFIATVLVGVPAFFAGAYFADEVKRRP